MTVSTLTNRQPNYCNLSGKSTPHLPRKHTSNIFKTSMVIFTDSLHNHFTEAGSVPLINR